MSASIGAPQKRLTESLSRVPTVKLAMAVARLEFQAVGRRIGRVLGFRELASVDDEDFRFPDSDLATRSVDLLTKCAPPFLVNHSLRSYLFAVALAKAEKLRVDRELLFVSSVFHDLGLVKDYDGPGSFEPEGAKAARAFLLAQGMPEERAAIVHEAIALHSSVGVADKHRSEIALVHYGTGMDVMGMRAEDFSPIAIQRIVAAYPRLDFKRNFAPLVKDQVERKPECHIAGPVRVGFLKRIANAPFAE